jgi:adenylate cyclase
MKNAPAVQKTAPAVTKSAAASPPATAAATGANDGMSRETLVIVFIDLARFQIASRRVKDAALVEILEDYYARIVDGLKPAGGRVVKFMGDGALVVFAVDRASQAARAILMLKADVDVRLAKRKFVTPLVARVHAGEVMAGPFGAKGDKRYDVIGQAVNRAAAMPLGEIVSLTGDAFAKLDPKTQKLFKPKGDYFVPA